MPVLVNYVSLLVWVVFAAPLSFGSVRSPFPLSFGGCGYIFEEVDFDFAFALVDVVVPCVLASRVRTTGWPWVLGESRPREARPEDSSI